MKVLVTGGSGLIGRHTVAALLAQGDEVHTFQRTAGPIAAGATQILGDVTTEPDGLCTAAQGCEAIVHLAGRGDVGESRHDPTGAATLNATGTLHALQAARAAGAQLVLASTQRVYPLQPALCRETDPPLPDSPYGYAKWVAELWCRMASEQFGVSTRTLRFFSVYGPGQQPNGGSGVVTIFARAALGGERLRVQSAGRRDFTAVADVVRGILASLALPPDGRARVYNIATGEGTTFRALAELIHTTSESRAPIQDEIVEPAGRDLVADISLAERELGFRPRVPLSIGIAEYLQWLRQNSS
jgi:UDP-glucose 4-epimerase